MQFVSGEAEKLTALSTLNILYARLSDNKRLIIHNRAKSDNKPVFQTNANTPKHLLVLNAFAPRRSLM